MLFFCNKHCLWIKFKVHILHSVILTLFYEAELNVIIYIFHPDNNIQMRVELFEINGEAGFIKLGFIAG